MSGIQNAVLADLLQTRIVTDDAGHEYPAGPHGVSEAHAAALYRTVLRERPALVVEIGMAWGVSSLAILSALQVTGGHLISIDPFQHEGWHGIGVHHVRIAGFADRHTLIEEMDYTALPRLLGEGTTIDLAYIDGWHTFDYTLIDAFYLDKMLRVGGILGFNDCWMQAVHKVVGYLRTHRAYDEIDVGLPRQYRDRDKLRTLRRVARQWSTADRYFRKREQWEPDWDYFAAF